MVANGHTTYQNGNIKSDVAVIDIIDDGKLYLYADSNVFQI